MQRCEMKIISIDKIKLNELILHSELFKGDNY